MRDLLATLDDKATFWMLFTDFAHAFNRLFITRLFPPTWHQLTLHSGVLHKYSAPAQEVYHACTSGITFC